MTRYTLETFCSQYTQGLAAEILSCTQGAISQAIKANREIYIDFPCEGEDENPSWFEIKKKIKQPKTKTGY